MRAARRGFAVACLAVLTISGMLGLAEQPARAAQNWYVALTGNNANNCTAPATPCATLAGVLNKPALADGDTIYVRPGTYATTTAATRVPITKGVIIQREPSTSGAITLNGGGAFLGSAVLTVNAPGKVVSISDVTVSNGLNATTAGVALLAGTLNTANFTVASNFGIPGGLSIAAGSTYAQTGGAFTSNVSGANTNGSNGGAVLVAGRNGATPAGQASFDGVTFTGNGAVGGTSGGGALPNTGNGGAIFNAGSTTVRNSTFTGNAVAASTAGVRKGMGGAIANSAQDADDAPQLTLTNVTVNGSSPAAANAAFGGAIANVDNALGVANGADGVLNATNLTINGPVATAGGGISNGGTLVIDGGSIKAAAFQGGALYQARLAAGPAPTATLTDVDLLGNVATNLAGAIANIGTNTNAGSSTVTLVRGQVSGSTSLGGGGAYVAAGTTLRATDTDFRDNIVTPVAAANFASGGAVYNLGTTEITGGELTGNKVTAHASTASTGLGGAIYTAGGSVEVTDAVLRGNSAVGSAAASTGVGGAIYQQVGGLTISGSTIDGNSAVGTAGANTGLGGAIFSFLGSALVIEDTDVTANTVSGTSNTSAVGAGIYSASPLDIDGGTISRNTGASNGGGLVNLVAATIDGTRIEGNQAALGAGISNSAAASASGLVLTDVDIVDNDSASAAGVYNTGKLTATDTSLDGNTATGTVGGTGLGGGFVNAGTISFTGGSISGNTASAAPGTAIAGLGGGGLNAGADARVTLSQVDVAGNRALGSADDLQTGWGGAFYNGSNGANVNASISIDRSTVRGNSALAGGAILGLALGNSTSKVAVQRSTVVGNSAPSAAFGGFYVGSTGSTLSVSESTVTDNVGAIVQNQNASATVSGSILFGNGGPSCAVANSASVTSGGSNLAATGDTSCGLTAAKGDVFGDPQLAALAANGGPTQTRLPNATTSPALDRITAGTATGATNAVSGQPVVLCAAAQDQRGSVRPSGAKCDIGAVEVQQTAPELTGPASGTFTVGTAGELVGFSATGNPTPTLGATGLPTGLTLQSTGAGTAKISGTPAAGTGGTYAVTVTATNEAGASSITVNVTVNQAPAITGPATVRFVETFPGSGSYTATGFPAPVLSLTGPLPSGVSFSGGTISGTPDAGTAGSYPVTITASNGVGPNAVLPVVVEVAPLLTITTTTLPDGALGVTYAASVVSIGGLPPYSYTLSSGSLPAGLTLAPNGTISGVPTALGTSTFTVLAKDSSTPFQVDAQELSITIGKGPTTLNANPVVVQRNLLGINIGSVNATLTGGNPGVPLAGQTIVFKAGATTVCTGVTNAQGFVSCSMTVGNTLITVLNLGVTGTYAGSAQWNPSSGSAGLL